jgi:hypothetical protein
LQTQGFSSYNVIANHPKDGVAIRIPMKVSEKETDCHVAGAPRNDRVGASKKFFHPNQGPILPKNFPHFHGESPVKKMLKSVFWKNPAKSCGKARDFSTIALEQLFLGISGKNPVFHRFHPLYYYC